MPEASVGEALASLFDDVDAPAKANLAFAGVAELLHGEAAVVKGGAERRPEDLPLKTDGRRATYLTKRCTSYTLVVVVTVYIGE